MDLFYQHTFGNLRDVYTGMPIQIDVPWWRADQMLVRPYTRFTDPHINRWMWFSDGAELRSATMLEF